MCSTLPLPLRRGSWDLSGYQKSLASLPRTPWFGCSQMYGKDISRNRTTVWFLFNVQIDLYLKDAINPPFACLPPPIVADDVNCILCDSPGDLLDQLFCTSCGQHYHGICLDMAVTPLRRAGWQCPECKICQTCKWVSFPPTQLAYFTLFLYSSLFPLLLFCMLFPHGYWAGCSPLVCLP